MFTPEGWKDYTHWRKANRAIFDRLTELIDEVRRNPYTGSGNPEPLRHSPGTWSRRIRDEHRFIYRPDSHDIVITRARGHYSST